MIEEAREWCRGKQWWWRSLLLIWFGVIFVEHLKDPLYTSVLHLLNLPIHEMGHLIFSLLGNHFITVLGGTILQLAAPMAGFWNFFIQRDFFAMALCFGWLSTNLFDVSRYMKDARSMQLDLVTVGSQEPGHDWHYLFGQMGLLPLDHVIGGFVWFLAVLSMGLCFWAGGWLVLKMFK